MKICICGWYYRPKFLQAIKESGYEAFVVQHRPGDTHGIPSAMHPNLGLEFGAYRQYLENHWDGVSDVLFLHDDTELPDIDALKDIEGLAGRGVEQAYIFHDENEEYINGGAHGRGIWIRADMLARLKGDFPADLNNGGVNIGVQAQNGIIAFHERLKTLGKNTIVCAIVPQIRFGHRGRIHTEMFVYRKTDGPVPGGIVNVA